MKGLMLIKGTQAPRSRQRIVPQAGLSNATRIPPSVQNDSSWNIQSASGLEKRRKISASFVG